MKLIYDPDTDTLSLLLRDEAVAESDELREWLIIDYARNGGIVAIEILDASEHVAEPRSIAYEMRGRQRAS